MDIVNLLANVENILVGASGAAAVGFITLHRFKKLIPGTKAELKQEVNEVSKNILGLQNEVRGELKAYGKVVNKMMNDVINNKYTDPNKKQEYLQMKSDLADARVSIEGKLKEAVKEVKPLEKAVNKIEESNPYR